MTPAFAKGTTAYTATTTDATNKLTATPEDEGATVEVKLGANAVTVGGDGKYALTWADGENTVTVKAVNGTVSKTYTLTVTKPAAEPDPEPGG